MTRPPPAAPTGLDREIAAALDLLRQGRARDAETRFRRLHAEAPGHPDVLHGLGLARKGQGRLDEAVGYLRQASAAAPAHAGYAANLGNALQQAGDLDGAIAAYRRATANAPGVALGHRNLGALLQMAGRPAEAVPCLRRAVDLAPDDAEAHSNLGAALRETAGIAAALPCFERALALDPGHAGAAFNRANALHSVGETAAARAGYDHAVAADPGHAWAWFNLHALVFDAAAPAAALAALDRAVAADPGFAMARAFRAMCRDLAGDAAGMREDAGWIAANAPGFGYLLDSWAYVQAHRGPETRLLAGTFETLAVALDAALDSGPADGLVLEFGVHRGASTRFLAGRTGREVHGFDSFEGLPDDWASLPAGAYTTGGELPAVPANVRLHRGWFDETLPGFAAAHPGPAAFLNVDCDLYASTRTVFAHVGDRLVPGTVIVFDEYLCNPTWRDDEFRAFAETVAGRGLAYDYLAFSPFSKQAAVVIR